MTDERIIQELAAHEYLVRLDEGGDAIEIRLHASPAILARIGAADSDEENVVDATVSYLIARQRADDLPGKLDLEDVDAAYEGYVDAIRRHLEQE